MTAYVSTVAVRIIGLSPSLDTKSLFFPFSLFEKVQACRVNSRWVASCEVGRLD